MARSSLLRVSPTRRRSSHPPHLRRDESRVRTVRLNEPLTGSFVSRSSVARNRIELPESNWEPDGRNQIPMNSSTPVDRFGGDSMLEVHPEIARRMGSDAGPGTGSTGAGTARPARPATERPRPAAAGSLPRLACSALALLALLAGSAPAQDDGLFRFAELAETFRQGRGISAAVDGIDDFQSVLDGHYVSVQLGVFDVRYPREALGEKGRVADLNGVLAGLVELQTRWLEWAGDGEDGQEAVEDSAKVLLKFLRSAKAPRGSADDGTNDYLNWLGAGDKVGAALEAFTAAIRSGDATRFPPRRADPARIVLSPTRDDFLQLAGFIGLVDESNRETYWQDGVATWTEFWWFDVQVVAMQYPPSRPDPQSPGEGVSMDAREKTGLRQHVVQRAALGLFDVYLEDGLDPAVELGLAQALVVDLYGENNVRSGGANGGRSRDGMQGFVPGGNSSGGALPPANADSPWRGDRGSDWFVKVLRSGQKNGAKGAEEGRREKTAWFRVMGSDDVARGYVRAPFLGSAAAGAPLPDEAFLPDYLEFFRAYKTGFAHWLRTEAGGKKRSAELFSALLSRLADPEGPAGFEAAVLEVYGVPLSAADDSTDSLEWRFLAWLAKR